jgi:predicted lipoprotein with Yx(FWY)xxD motif
MAIRAVEALDRSNIEETTMKKHLLAGLGLILALALLGACSSDDGDEETSTGAGTEETTDDSAGDDAATEDDASGEVVGTADTELGEVLADADGLSLYGFTEDVDGVPTCTDACADAWPPLLVDSSELPEGLDAAVFSVVERPDGDFQLVAGDFPLYRFAGDSGEGDTAGQGSGDVWFLAAPDGSLIQDDAAATEGTEAVDDGYGY